MFEFVSSIVILCPIDFFHFHRQQLACDDSCQLHQSLNVLLIAKPLALTIELQLRVLKAGSKSKDCIGLGQDMMGSVLVNRMIEKEQSQISARIHQQLWYAKQAAFHNGNNIGRVQRITCTYASLPCTLAVAFPAIEAVPEAGSMQLFDSLLPGIAAQP